VARAARRIKPRLRSIRAPGVVTILRELSSGPVEGTQSSLRLQSALAGVLLAGLAIALYAQVLDFEFVAFDDVDCVIGHPVVGRGLDWETARTVFAQPVCANWTPLAWLSHMLDVSLYGRDGGGHHLTSALLHVANVLLLFFLLRSLTGAVWRSALVATLFAAHPLHVESVAWIAERRDVLSQCFGLCALWAYGRWARGAGGWAYAVAFFTLALGLLSKSMLVTLPLLFLLLDYWPLGRLRIGAGAGGAGLAPGRLLLEKAPFFALAGAIGVVTLLAQSGGGSAPGTGLLPVGVRIENALVSTVLYLRKVVWPVDLAVLYPHPILPGGAAPWTRGEAAAAALFLLAVTAAALRLRRHGYVPVGWLWFLIALAPVIGLIQVGQHAMADRYTYLPLIGIYVATVWGASDAVGARDSRRLVALASGAAILVIAALVALSVRQIATWRDSFTLFTHAIEVTRGNFSAHFNLANLYKGRGDTERARRHYEQAVAIHPTMARAHLNFANMLVAQELLDEAIEHYVAAAIATDDPRALHGVIRASLRGDGGHARLVRHLREIVERNPYAARSWTVLGQTLRTTGSLDEAIEAYGRAAALRPGDAAIRRSLDDARAVRER
jgi:tetratricopeptide (TPR) repeat protein